VYTYSYMSVCVYIYECMCIPTGMPCLYIHVFIYECMCILIRIDVCAFHASYNVRRDTCWHDLFIHIRTRIRICASPFHIFTCTYTYMCIYIHVYVYVYVSPSVCVCVCTCACVCACVYVCVCMCVCVCVCECVCKPSTCIIRPMAPACICWVRIAASCMGMDKYQLSGFRV